MPTYGYQCTQCKHEFQVFQAMKDDPISLCPQCEGKVKRLLYPVGVVFKGSGWYINDSRKPDPAESKPESADAKSGDSKPAAESTSPTADKSSSETKPTPAAASE